MEINFSSSPPPDYISDINNDILRIKILIRRVVWKNIQFIMMFPVLPQLESFESTPETMAIASAFSPESNILVYIYNQ